MQELPIEWEGEGMSVWGGDERRRDRCSSLSLGLPGAKGCQERCGDRLVRVRYRGITRRRVRSTTVEIIVEEAFWDPEGFQTYKAAMSKVGVLDSQ